MNKLFSSALSFGKTPCRLQVEFDNAPSGSSTSEALPVFRNKDTVSGRVQVIPKSGKTIDHLGLRVQLVGEIVLKSDKSHPHEFLSLVRDLAPPGDLTSVETHHFNFKDVEMEYESYIGSQVSLRYSVRVILARSLGQTVIQDHFFNVQNPVPAPHVLNHTGSGYNDQDADEMHHGDDNEDDHRIKMEVGIEDCLHIEFEYGRTAYHLRDVIVGKINFMLVKIKLKHMELEIKRRETVGSGIQAHLESTTVAKFEIMDGAPTKGESIPIRLYLSPYPLSPSYENIQNKFSVKYSINLVLVDEEDRRYFKQQEIRLYRLDSEVVESRKSSWNFFSGMRHHLDPKLDLDGGQERVCQLRDIPDDSTGAERRVINCGEESSADGIDVVATEGKALQEDQWQQVEIDFGKEDEDDDTL
jgi:vacuolar protein sorting-associated protein 26